MVTNGLDGQRTVRQSHFYVGTRERLYFGNCTVSSKYRAGQWLAPVQQSLSEKSQ